MAINKTRSKTQREERLTEVAALHRRGCTQVQIAAQLGISQPQVAYDLQIVRTRYRDTQLHDRGALVAEKLEQFREVRKVAWDAWEHSKEEACKVVEEFAATCDLDLSRDDTERRIKRTVTKAGRLPANEYLGTVMRTLEAERELLGLDEPKDKLVTLEQVMVVVSAFKDAARDVLSHHPELLRAFQVRTVQILPVDPPPVR